MAPLSLKDLRIKAGMTQQTMAEILQTSRSQVAMAELGVRALPVHSIHLMLALEENLKYAPAIEIKDRAYLISTNSQMIKDLEGDWDFKLKTATYHKAKFEHKLYAMIRSYDESLSAYNAISHTLQQASEDSTEGYVIVARFQASELRRKLTACNEASQLKLRVKIDLYASQIDVLNSFLKEVED